MKKIGSGALAFAVLVSLPAHANTSCLQIGRVWSFKPLANRTLIIEDDLHQKFRVALMSYCPHLPFKLNLAIQSTSGVNGLDCVRRGDNVVSQDAGGPYTCPVMSVVPYTADMEKADKAKSAGEESR